jgi:hypothetical protein
MGGNDEQDDVQLTARLPARLIAVAIAGVLAGGLGVGTLAPVGIDRKATQACFKQAEAALRGADTAIGIAERAAENAKIAIGVAADHGKELETTNRRVESLYAGLVERTSDRYTGGDADKRAREVDRQHDKIESRVDRNERRLNTLEGFHGMK